MTNVAIAETGAEINSFKDPRGLAGAVSVLLYTEIVISIARVISSAMQYNLLLDFQSGSYSDRSAIQAAANSNDLREQIIGYTWIAFFIPTGILILKWIYRSSYNLRPLGAENLTTSPGWAVGWFFIPFMNLYKPFVVMKEIWKASSDPRSWKTASSSSLIGWWWALFLASSVLGNFAFRLSQDAQGLPQLLNASLAGGVAAAVFIPLNLLFLRLMRAIVAMQVARHGNT